MTDLLELLIAADRAWSLRRHIQPRSPEYLVHLAAAAGADPLERAAEVERLRVERDAAVEHVATLVSAITGRWSKRQPAARQVTAALKQLDTVRAYLESLWPSPETTARTG